MLADSAKTKSEDALFIDDANEKAIGLADGKELDEFHLIQRNTFSLGVGGWKNYNIDPSAYSNFLMNQCQNLILKQNVRDPLRVLKEAYESSKQVTGKNSQTTPLHHELIRKLHCLSIDIRWKHDKQHKHECIENL